MSAVPKLLLVGWELADWRMLHPLMDAGFLPNLEQLVNRGIIADLSPGPWDSVTTGRQANSPPGRPLWSLLADAGRRCHVVRWPGSHPAAALPAGGVYVSDAFNRAPRPDEVAAAAAAGAGAALLPAVEPESQRAPLEALRMVATDLLLDELRPFVLALERLVEKDRGPMNWLAEAYADARTTQNVATHLLAHEPWDVAMIHYAALGAISRQFLQLSQEDDSPYASVPATAVVIGDQMLGPLIASAGEDAIVCVCSAYGLLNSAMTVLAGPGIREDERLAEKDGAAAPPSAADLLPTLCALAGVPLPPDTAATLPGRAWNVNK